MKFTHTDQKKRTLKDAWGHLAVEKCKLKQWRVTCHWLKGHHKKAYKEKLQESMWIKRNITWFSWDCILVIGTTRTLWRFLKKVKIELPSDQAIPLMGASRGNHSWLRQRTLCFTLALFTIATSLVAQTVRHLPTMWETRVQSLGWEDLLEKKMATHSSILAWQIPWMEEPGGLQSMGLQRVGHDWVISLHFHDSQNRKTPNSPWSDAEWYIYRREYYSAIKTNEIMPFATT